MLAFRDGDHRVDPVADRGQSQDAAGPTDAANPGDQQECNVKRRSCPCVA